MDKSQRKALLLELLSKFSHRKTAKSIMGIITFFCVTFIAFVLFSIIFGGDAVDGKIEDGHFYFGSHGEYTEVSCGAYVASAGYIMLLSAIVGVVLVSIFLFSIRGVITCEYIKKASILDIFLLLPLLIGGGSLYVSFLALKCILRAFGII
jgi:hypothetical protein